MKKLVITFTVIIFILLACLCLPFVLKTHFLQKPTVDISELPLLEVFYEGDDCITTINGRQYEVYGGIEALDSKIKNIIEQEIHQNDIVAYQSSGGRFWYFATFNDIGEDWLIEFRENKSKGSMDPENIETLWKASDANSVPDIVYRLIAPDKQ